MTIDGEVRKVVIPLRDTLVLLATERAKLRARLETFFTVGEQVQEKHHNFEISMQEFISALDIVENLEKISRIYNENYGRKPTLRGRVSE